MSARRRRDRSIEAASGLALVSTFIAIAALAPWLDRSLPEAMQPRRVFIALLVAAGLAWLAWAWRLWRARGRGGALLWIAIVGLTMRGAMFAAPPILEDDYHRYLWDGAVTAAGVNPYATAPAEARRLAADRGAASARSGPIDALADEGQATLGRVNHPRFRSIYPPTAQAAFAVAHWIAPWSVGSMRLVLLAFDAATALLLFALLGRLALPRSWTMVYWCNPLIVLQTLGAVHMDVVAVAFAAGAVFVALDRRVVASAGLIALAAGAKVWPVMLLPLVLRFAVRSRGDLPAAAVGVVVAGAVGALMAWPILLAGLGPDSGFEAYAGRWDNNAGLFALHREAWRAVLPRFGVHPGHGDDLARWITAAALALGVVALAIRPIRSGRALVDRCLIAVAALFLLSPTQFPWYYIWLMPMLAIRPVAALWLYTPLLALYYLQGDWAGVVWIEHLPVLALLAYELSRWSRGRSATRSASPPGPPLGASHV